MYTASCDQPLTLGAGGELLCQGTLFVTEAPITLSSLDMDDVGMLLTATVTLFAVAFGFKFVWRFFMPPGRS